MNLLSTSIQYSVSKVYIYFEYIIVFSKDIGIKKGQMYQTMSFVLKSAYVGNLCVYQ